MRDFIFLYYSVSLCSGFAGITALGVELRRSRNPIGRYALAILCLFGLYLAALNVHFYQRMFASLDNPWVRETTKAVFALAMGGLFLFIPTAARLYSGRRVPALEPTFVRLFSVLPFLNFLGGELFVSGLGRITTILTWIAFYSILLYSLAILIRRGSIPSEGRREADPRPIIAFLAAAFFFQAVDSVFSGLEFKGYPITILPLAFLFANVAIVLRTIAQRSIPAAPDADDVGEVDASDSSAFARELGITIRELEIAALLAEGMAYKGIAFELGISLSTVKNHIHNTFMKTGAKNRMELAALLARGKAAKSTACAPY